MSLSHVWKRVCRQAGLLEDKRLQWMIEVNVLGKETGKRQKASHKKEPTTPLCSFLSAIPEAVVRTVDVFYFAAFAILVIYGLSLAIHDFKVRLFSPAEIHQAHCGGSN